MITSEMKDETTKLRLTLKNKCPEVMISVRYERRNHLASFDARSKCLEVMVSIRNERRNH